MQDHDCQIIGELWIQLNPHCRVEGCWIDPAGSVQLYLWYSSLDSATGLKKTNPLELCLGNPPRTVIRGLRNAVRMQTAGRRLAGGEKVIKDLGSPALPARRDTSELK